MAKKSRAKRKSHRMAKRKAIAKGLIAYIKGGGSRDAFNKMKNVGVTEAEWNKAIRSPASDYFTLSEAGLYQSTPKRRKK
jgi:hypothetical protein